MISAIKSSRSELCLAMGCLKIVNRGAVVVCSIYGISAGPPCHFFPAGPEHRYEKHERRMNEFEFRSFGGFIRRWNSSGAVCRHFFFALFNGFLVESGAEVELDRFGMVQNRVRVPFA